MLKGLTISFRPLLNNNNYYYYYQHLNAENEEQVNDTWTADHQSTPYGGDASKMY